MNVLIFGARKETIADEIKKSGFRIVENNPELVICYGGDGTFMRAEFAFPGVPKLLLRGSHICKLCSEFSNADAVARVKNGSYRIEEYSKLEVQAQDKTLIGVNDIVLHNGDPRHGIRYYLWVNDRRVGGEIIGDGIVVATPLGSTGYYRSITDSSFETGIGLAFNNSTEQSDHIVLKDESIIKLKILRGPAVLYADNQKESITLEEESEAIIKKAKNIARLVKAI